MTHMQMTIKTTRIADLPAVIATYHGHITREDVEQMYTETAHLLADAGARYYRICDVRAMKMDIREFVEILLSVREDGPFRSADPNLQLVFAGTNPWIFSISSVLSRRGIRPWICDTMEAALAYVRADWAAYTPPADAVD